MRSGGVEWKSSGEELTRRKELNERGPLFLRDQAPALLSNLQKDEYKAERQVAGD